MYLRIENRWFINPLLQRVKREQGQCSGQADENYNSTEPAMTQPVHQVVCPVVQPVLEIS